MASRRVRRQLTLPEGGMTPPGKAGRVRVKKAAWRNLPGKCPAAQFPTPRKFMQATCRGRADARGHGRNPDVNRRGVLTPIGELSY
jgi:hypothetical protein